MGVTIDDIYNKQFIERNGGYDPDDVDDFLNAIMDEMTEMQQENEKLRKELAQARDAAEMAGSTVKGFDEDASVIREQLQRVQSELQQSEQEKNALISNLEAMKQQLQVAKSQPAKPTAGAASETLETILVNAQKLADDAVAQARNRAKSIVDDAKAEADQIIGNANGEKDMLTAQLEGLRKSAAEYKSGFKAMLESYMSMIDKDDFLK